SASSGWKNGPARTTSPTPWPLRSPGSIAIATTASANSSRKPEHLNTDSTASGRTWNRDCLPAGQSAGDGRHDGDARRAWRRLRGDAAGDRDEDAAGASPP